MNDALDVVHKLVGGKVIAVPETIKDEIEVCIIEFLVARDVADCAVFVAAEAG
jgi:hypothetical protein